MYHIDNSRLCLGTSIKQSNDNNIGLRLHVQIQVASVQQCMRSYISDDNVTLVRKKNSYTNSFHELCVKQFMFPTTCCFIYKTFKFRKYVFFVLHYCFILQTLVSSEKINYQSLGFRVKVFCAISNAISVISWWSVVLIEETGRPGENQPPAASH